MQYIEYGDIPEQAGHNVQIYPNVIFDDVRAKSFEIIRICEPVQRIFTIVKNHGQTIMPFKKGSSLSVCRT